MGPLLPVGDGHTPLDEDDSRGLKLSYISTRGELNEAEQENILRAISGRRAPSAEALLTDRYLRELHRAMFGEVWDWAGTYRRTETNIGIEPSQISGAVRNLVHDARWWVESKSEPEDTVGVRLHHRLVSIHPFTNGKVGTAASPPTT
jgi:Fic-DOC domain mobile mystery protein B